MCSCCCGNELIQSLDVAAVSMFELNADDYGCFVTLAECGSLKIIGCNLMRAVYGRWRSSAG